MEDAGKLLEGSKRSVSMEGAARGLGWKCMAGGIFRRFVDTGHSKKESARGEMMVGAHTIWKGNCQVVPALGADSLSRGGTDQQCIDGRNTEVQESTCQEARMAEEGIYCRGGLARSCKGGVCREYGGLSGCQVMGSRSSQYKEDPAGNA